MSIAFLIWRHNTLTPGRDRRKRPPKQSTTGGKPLTDKKRNKLRRKKITFSSLNTLHVNMVTSSCAIVLVDRSAIASRTYRKQDAAIDVKSDQESQLVLQTVSHLLKTFEEGWIQYFFS